MSDYTEEELTALGMSDEEIAAIMDGEDDQTGADTDDDLQGAETDTDTDQDEDKSGDEGDPNPEKEDTDKAGTETPEGGEDVQDDTGTEAGDDPGEGGQKEEQQQAEEVEQPKDAPVEQQSVKLPEDVAEQFQTRLGDLSKKFDEGEIELSEYLDERDKINREVYNAEVEFSEKVNASNVWKADMDRFFAENKFYLDDSNQKRWDDLDLCVKTVANSGERLSNTEILNKAKAMEQAMNGAVETPANPAPKKEEKKPAPKSPRPEAPNLSEMPAAGENETSNNEFAHLDNLTGLELEEALSRLPKEKLDRYLQS